MGTWGRGILSDDFARDIYDDYVRAFNRGEERDQITQRLIAANAHGIDDPDEGPVFWLALAKAQWDTGPVDDQLLAQVEDLAASDRGLDRWREAGEKELAKRRAAVAEFAARLRVPNAAPRKRSPPKFVRAPFRRGTCLAILLPDGQFGAAIVLRAREGVESYGLNLVAALHYKSGAKPGAHDFEAREWLALTHHKFDGGPLLSWCVKRGFRGVRKRLQPAGETELRHSDPGESESYCRWDFILDQIVRQFQWEAGDEGS